VVEQQQAIGSTECQVVPRSSSTVNVRNGNGLSSGILGSLTRNTPLAVVDQVGDWYQVDWPQAPAYVAGWVTDLQGQCDGFTTVNRAPATAAPTAQPIDAQQQAQPQVQQQVNNNDQQPQPQAPEATAVPPTNPPPPQVWDDGAARQMYQLPAEAVITWYNDEHTYGTVAVGGDNANAFHFNNPLTCELDGQRADNVPGRIPPGYTGDVFGGTTILKSC